jgi:hypothetical protein
MQRTFQSIEIEPTDAAYLAGIIDGEGWVSIGQQQDRRQYSRNYYYLMVGVTNTDEALVRWVREVTGRGTVSVRNVKGSLGTKPQWIWVARGWAAGDVLRVVQRYMRIKQRKAMLGIQFQEYRDANQQMSVGRTIPVEVTAQLEAFHQEMYGL